ncbi:MAG: PAS domain S-box protein [Halosimplex sp.]
MQRLSEQASVLHVDDERDQTESTATALAEADDRLHVEHATSVAEGLERLEDGAFDCVVSDYEMPDCDGIEFLEAVRADYPDLPFVLYTGEGSEAIASEAISAGVTDYLRTEADTDQRTVLADRVLDAVEQHRSRTDLEASQQRLSLFFDQSPLGVIEWDADYRLVRMNGAAEDILGYNQSELVGESWERLVPESDRETVGDVVAAVREDAGGYHSVNENVRKDGARITCEWHNRVVTDESGDVVAIFSQFQDVTERVRHGRAVAELHEQTRALMRAETPQEIADICVSAVRDILRMPANAVHLYEERADGECLHPVAWTDRCEELLGTVPDLYPGEALAWEVFESGDSRVYDDVSTVPGRLAADTTIQSEIILPLGDHGVFLIGSADPSEFDDTDVSLAETLSAHATTALDRIERERELAEERAFVDQALDSITDIFYVVDAEGSLLRWNDHARAITGYSDEELAEANAFELFPEEHHDRVASGIAEGLREGQAAIEADLLTADGDRIPHEFVGARLTDTDGEVVGVVGIGRDVTERREYERRIERLQHRTQLLMHTPSKERTAEVAIETAEDVLDAPLAGFFLVSEDGQSLEPVALSEGVRDHLDDPPVFDRGSGNTFSTLVWDAFEAGSSRVVDDLHDHGRVILSTPTRSAVVYPLAEYGVFVASSREVAAFDETDEALVEIVATSLTTALDRVERERDLETERDRLSALFEMVPDPITHVRFEDGEPILLDVNSAFEDAFGRDAADVIGHSSNDILVPSGQRTDAQAIDEQVHAEGIVSREVRRTTPDGIGDFLFRSVPVGDPAETDEYFGVYVDISEQKATERRLERQNDRLEEFASIVSHDLRNPLNVAQGRLEVITDGRDPEADRIEVDADQLDAIRRAHDRMEALISDLLTLARGGDAATDRETARLDEIARKCWRTVDTGAASLNVETDRTLRADTGQLRQLLENSFRNAIEHGGSDVTVTIGALEDGFFVEDDGSGIPEDERERVFDTGFSTTTDGTGFGLGIVEQVVDAHDWSIAVTESADGGARFEITGIEAAEAVGDSR